VKEALAGFLLPRIACQPDLDFLGLAELHRTFEFHFISV